MPVTASNERSGRPRLSCDACYQRKIGCVEVPGVSRCDWCLHHGTDCVYTPSRRRRPNRTKTAGSVTTGIKRRLLESQASTLEKIGNTSSYDGSSLYTRRLLENSQEMQVHGDQNLGKHERPTQFLNSIPLLSFAAPKMLDAGSRVSQVLSTVVRFGAPWAKQMTSYSAPATSLYSARVFSKLPDRFITEAAIAFYATNKTGLLRAVPSIDMVTSAIETAYSDSPSQSLVEVNTSHALVYAFVAFCSLAGHSQKRNYPVDGKELAMEARRLSPAAGSSPSSPESLQVSLLLAVCHCVLGELLEARETFSIIASQLTELAIKFHLFKLSPEGLPLKPDAENKHPIVLRDLLWISLMVDNEIFLRTGQPPLILAKLAASAFPCDYESSPQFLASFLPPRTADPRADVYIYMADLTLHVSRLYISLYASKAFAKSSIELLQTIMSLDSQLEEWRLSIPKPFRPTIHVFKLPTHSLCDIDLLLLNLKFHHTLGCIHQVVHRCQSWVGETASSREALESSLNISVQASVSSLELLRATKLALNPEIFWLLCFYLLSAHLNLFCRIVANPLDCESRSHLQILQASPVSLRRIDTRHLTRAEIEHLSVLVEFCTDLVIRAEHEVAGASLVEEGRANQAR